MLIFNEFPEFELDGFILREILPDYDAENFYNYVTHPDIASQLSRDDLPKSQVQALSELQYWANLYIYKRSVFWAIADNANEMVGMIGFNNFSPTHKRVEISYDLNKDYWGRSIMSSAMSVVSDFAWQEMQTNRLQATVAVTNCRSIKLLESCGFNKEGTLHKFGCINDIVTDYYMYAKVK